jgi:predicted AlkP superfamily phosphohydrolase/phosphomutase
MKFNRLFLWAAIPAAAALAVSTCSRKSTRKPARETGHKVFVMGFDGMDPTLAQKYMDEGKLPNLKRLAETGTFATLQTTQPSESPVAWASFATGVNPGRHNIYDFLVRDLETYMPAPGGVSPPDPPNFLFGLFPTSKPKVTSTRGGTSFWQHAGYDGVRSIVLTVPMTFPPEEIEHGEMLAGLPLPDIRSTLGTFYYWATDLTSFEEGNTEFGGSLKRLSFENGKAETVLRGPESPLLKRELLDLRAKRAKKTFTEKDERRLTELTAKKDINLPLEVHWKRGEDNAEIQIAGTRKRLKVGEWSEWIPLTFKINALISIHGMTQVHLIRADDELRIFAHPVNWDPRNPPFPISKPDDFAPRLAKEIGLFRTLGWAESADKALNEQRIDEATFLYDCERALEDRERLIFKNLERNDWDMFIAVVETTDRVSHMMWRLIDPKHPMYDAELAAKYGDSIEKIYRRADDLVGRIQAKLPPDTTLFVMSDHGFHSFRRGVNLNTWLVQNGYLVFEGVDQGPGSTQQTRQLNLEELFQRGGQFWEGVDWSRTKAYAVGLGQIYFNLRGRESRGIVSAGAEYKALQEEIAAKLVTLVDTDDGAQVFRDIYRRDDIYKGEYLNNAPDLQVGFNDGYRVGWQDTLGGIRRTVIENNNRKWSGDHCATATEISGGVFFSNRKVPGKPHIMDMGPTVLKLLGVPVPPDLDGKPLL